VLDLTKISMKELEQASRFTDAGNFEIAEKVLLQIKQREPLNFDVIHTPGLVTQIGATLRGALRQAR
jgi:hypothetical protein